MGSSAYPLIEVYMRQTQWLSHACLLMSRTTSPTTMAAPANATTIQVTRISTTGQSMHRASSSSKYCVLPGALQTWHKGPEWLLWQ